MWQFTWPHHSWSQQLEKLKGSDFRGRLKGLQSPCSHVGCQIQLPAGNCITARQISASSQEKTKAMLDKELTLPIYITSARKRVSKQFYVQRLNGRLGFGIINSSNKHQYNCLIKPKIMFRQYQPVINGSGLISHPKKEYCPCILQTQKAVMLLKENIHSDQ